MNPAIATPVTAAAILAYRWVYRHGIISTLDVAQPIRRARSLVRFGRDWRTYVQLPGAERLRLIDSFPQLDDRTSDTRVERHYFRQAVWATRHIAQSKVAYHVDVGSDHRMVAILAAFTHVSFTDIRPLAVTIDGLSCVAGSVTQLPYRDASIGSLSCLHVAEHVGLGRYGDPLDPLGTRKAAQELARVLAHGGNLFFSVPVGWSRVEFNAHRVHTPSQILSYFPRLRLVEFSAEDDDLRFHPKADPVAFEKADYACGMFWFTKPESSQEC